MFVTVLKILLKCTWVWAFKWPWRTLKSSLNKDTAKSEASRQILLRDCGVSNEVLTYQWRHTIPLRTELYKPDVQNPIALATWGAYGKPRRSPSSVAVEEWVSPQHSELWEVWLSQWRSIPPSQNYWLTRLDCNDCIRDTWFLVISIVGLEKAFGKSMSTGNGEAGIQQRLNKNVRLIYPSSVEGFPLQFNTPCGIQLSDRFLEGFYWTTC